MKPSIINESLCKLYFRLNGYFTTGLIIHSEEHGNNRTEIDCIGIKHPYHDQSEREVPPSEFLEIPAQEVDIIICEVKSDPKGLSFNEPLLHDTCALDAVIRWIGVFNENTRQVVVNRLFPLLTDKSTAEDFRNGISIEGYRIRPLLCCPPQFKEIPDKWCLYGSEIFAFIDKCFNPLERRDSCSTRYNFQQWGPPFTPIVTYLKEQSVKNKNDLNDLYENLDKA
jgi:hypothetical protein